MLMVHQRYIFSENKDSNAEIYFGNSMVWNEYTTTTTYLVTNGTAGNKANNFVQKAC